MCCQSGASKCPNSADWRDDHDQRSNTERENAALGPRFYVSARLTLAYPLTAGSPGDKKPAEVWSRRRSNPGELKAFLPVGADDLSCARGPADGRVVLQHSQAALQHFRVAAKTWSRHPVSSCSRPLRSAAKECRLRPPSNHGSVGTRFWAE